MNKTKYPIWWTDRLGCADWRRISKDEALQFKTPTGHWAYCWTSPTNRQMDKEHTRCDSRGRALGR
jgi:hypothetical protein